MIKAKIIEPPKLKASIAGGNGSSGTKDHAKLKNRDLVDQHPMSAVTNLVESLVDLDEDIAAERAARQSYGLSVVNGKLCQTYTV